MTVPAARPGQGDIAGRSFSEPLWLPGWSDRSIWGFDQATGSYFAQLWPDEDSNAEPTLWTSGCDSIESELQLATVIAEETDRDIVTVVRAMLLAGPAT